MTEIPRRRRLNRFMVAAVLICMSSQLQTLAQHIDVYKYADPNSGITVTVEIDPGWSHRSPSSTPSESPSYKPSPEEIRRREEARKEWEAKTELRNTRILKDLDTQINVLKKETGSGNLSVEELDRKLAELKSAIAEKERELAPLFEQVKEFPLYNQIDFQTDAASDSRKKLSETLLRRNAVAANLQPSVENYRTRVNLLSVADTSLSVADEMYVSGESDSGDFAVGVAMTLIDVAAGLTPGVSWGRDVYEAVTGRNLISGEELDSIERTTAIVGSITLGLGSKFVKGVAVFRKIASKIVRNKKAYVEAIEAAAKIAETASELHIPHSDLVRITNKSHHIFGPTSLEKHKLTAILNVFGGDQIAAYRAIETAAQKLADEGRIAGVFQNATVVVHEKSIIVRGAVINGKVDVATAFIE